MCFGKFKVTSPDVHDDPAVYLGLEAYFHLSMGDSQGQTVPWDMVTLVESPAGENSRSSPC
jgi:hypothetical protein